MSIEDDEVRLPSDMPNWPVVKELLQDLQERLISDSISEQETAWYMETIHSTIQSRQPLAGSVKSQLTLLKSKIQPNVRKKLDHSCLWFGMLKYLKKIPKDERENFLYQLLPRIIELALGIEDCKPALPLCISRQQQGGSSKLSRQFVSSVVACFFLCLFPDRHREKSSKLNIVNFTKFFMHLPIPSQAAKLKCILHYFQCVIDRNMELEGDIVFSRMVVPNNSLLTFEELIECDLSLCPLTVHFDGKMEDSGAGAIHVDFANRSIGGGVLGRSRVQEEIRFSICPELMAAMLFMENMENNEAIFISGFEQFSSYSGYADSFQFEGHYEGDGQVQSVVAIDATSYRSSPSKRQYEEPSVLRDLNKSLIGFSSVPGTELLAETEKARDEDERSGTIDIAADMVTSAMTDALRQASGSPLPCEVLEPQQLDRHHHQQHHREHHLLLPHHPHHHPQQQRQQQLPADSVSVSSGHTQQQPQDDHHHHCHPHPVAFSSQPSVSADSYVTDPLPLYTAASGSGNSDQPTAHLEPQPSSSPSSSVDPISIIPPADSQSSFFVHSTDEVPTSTSSATAQASISTPARAVFARRSRPLAGQAGSTDASHMNIQSEQLSGDSTYSLAYCSHVDSSQNADQTVSLAISHPTVSSALISNADSLVQEAVRPHSGSQFLSDILGNLTRIDSSTSQFSSLQQPYGESEKVDKDSQIHFKDEVSSSLESGRTLFEDHQTKSHDSAYDVSGAEKVADIVINYAEEPGDDVQDVSFFLPLSTDVNKTKFETGHTQHTQTLEKKTKGKTTSDVSELEEPVDVVLTLPSTHGSLERTGSGTSNLSMVVNVDSQNSHSLSANSTEEEGNRKPATELLYVDVGYSKIKSAKRVTMTGDSRLTSQDSTHLEPPLSLSPQSQSSVSSTNLSPNSSFTLPEFSHHEPPNGFHDVHVSADFFIPEVESVSYQAGHHVRRSRDFYGELRDFLSSSSSGSRESGSGGGPITSGSSSGGSRSGSISSHGTNGSTNDFLDFWHHFRRRSSQLSDTTSRRSSSSKHSTDFSTDLEEISESLQKHSHGVIEEEGSMVTVVTDFASHVVSAAVKNGVATGAHISTDKEEKVVVVQGELTEKSLVAIPERKEDASVKDVAEGLAGRDTVTALSKGRGKRPFSRVGTLVRQAEVNFEPDEIISLPSLEREPPEISESSVVPRPKSDETTISVTDESCDIEKEQSKPSTVAPVPSTISTFPKPAKSTTGLPVMSSKVLEPQCSDSLNQSLDSGFISTKSSIASSPPKPETSAGVSLALDAQVTAISTVETVSVHHSGGERQKEHESTDRDAGDLPKAEDSKTLYATLESKTIYFNPHNFPAAPSSSQPDVTPSQIPNQASAPLLLSSSKHMSSQRDLEVSKVQLKQEAKVVITETKLSDTQKKSNRLSQIPKSILLGAAAEKISKHSTSKPREKTPKQHDTDSHLPCPKPHQDSKVPLSRDAQASSSSASSPPSAPLPSSGASGPSKSSGIPKSRDASKKPADSARTSGLTGSKSKSSPRQEASSSSAKEKSKTGKERKQLSSTPSSSQKAGMGKERPEPLFRPHKSRYVFSDVAAPLSDRKKKPKSSSEISHKKQSRSSSKRHEEKRLKQKEGISRQLPPGLQKSQKFARFVNSIAEISLSQAVLEGAEIIARSPRSGGEIPDEIYNWFSSKIIGEVFSHVISDIETREYLASDQGPENQEGQPHLQEIGAAGEPAGLAAIQAASRSELASQSLGASATETFVAEVGSARPKTKSIIPSKSDTAASSQKSMSTSMTRKSSGSVKIVKFKDSGKEEWSPPTSTTAQTPVPGSSPSGPVATFQRQSSTIPVRRRSSFELSSPSPPASRAVASNLSILHSTTSSAFKPTLAEQSQPSEYRRSSLTSVDLSIDVYQAAANIVSQVFQTISDSMDTQALSPVSSGRHGTMSSTDTGIHSTGSRVHSHYDSFASNIFSSSSTKASESPKRTRRSVSPSIGIFTRKPMSRETLTSAFLKVERTPHIKSYERRSSEPCQTSVQLSLQAFNNNKFSSKSAEDRQRKISRTDDDIGRGRTWRRRSLDGFSFERRSSCGFKDPVLSRFAEELMKADTSVPELVIVGSHPSSSSASSRRSSVSAFRDTTLANLESELLNTSFNSLCSVSHSPRSQRKHPHLDRSRSRESRNWKSDSSDTEYWFPPPKFVGDEFQLEFNRQHSQEELQDYASFFAGRVVQEAVCVLKCDPDYMSREEQDVDMFAENLMDQIMRDALLTSTRGDTTALSTYASGTSPWGSLSIHTYGSDGDTHSFGNVSYSGTVGKQDTASLRTSHKHSEPTRHNVGGDASEAHPFYGEGARPKIKSDSSSVSRHAQSKPRAIPQRRAGRSRTVGGDNHRLDELYRQQSSGRSERQTPALCPNEGRYTSPSHQFHQSASQPSTDWLEDKPKEGSFSSYRTSADSKSSPSKDKHHSSPSFTSSSSFPVAISLSTSSKVSAKKSHDQKQYCQSPNEKHRRLRSKSESAPSGSSGIPVYRGYSFSEPPEPKKTATRSKRDSQSSTSSRSSYYSDRTRSSFVSSSSDSEGIGPTGRDSHHKKKLSDRRSKVSHISKKELQRRTSSSQPDPAKDSRSSGLRNFPSKLGSREKGHSRRKRVREKTSSPDHKVEPDHISDRSRVHPVVWEFAAGLSQVILDNAMTQCRENRWLRFVSRHKPIVTGNWGCGAFRGNAQLKLVMQWIAASIAKAPMLVYYTFNDQRLTQAEEIAQLISGWTVGQLAATLREYCNWVTLHMSSSDPSFSSTPRVSIRQQGRLAQQKNVPSHAAWQVEEEALLPQTLFDFLLEKHHLLRDE